MRKHLTALAVAGLFVASGAQAAVYEVGNLSALGDDGYGHSVSFSAGELADQFNFTISGGTNLFGSVLSKLSIQADQALTSFTGVITGPNAFYLELPNFAEFVDGIAVQGLLWKGSLESGDYSLNMSATANTHGTYQISLLASPVPEPGSVAMMLAGLGVMGAIARRRSKAKA